MKVEILPEARTDLLDGYSFYEDQQAGLGSFFLEALITEIESLSEYGGIHPLKFGLHRALVGRFPYAIYYRVENESVLVDAVIDCRRGPNWIRRRLGP